MIVKKEWLEANMTKAGGYTAKQLGLLGVSWPPRKGWKYELIGQELDNSKAIEFERCSRLSYEKP